MVLTIVVAVGMERLFLDNTFLRDVLALAIASHLVAIAARRAGLGMAAAGLLSFAAAIVTVTVLLYADTANIFLPSGETLELLRADLSEGWAVFSDDRAPVRVVPGFVIAIGVLLWVGAFLADWAAFRLRSPIEAVAPAGAVFVFTALLGAGENQILHGTLFAAAAALTLLTMRVNRQVREEVWIEPSRGRGPGATLRLGMLAGSVAVIAGAIFGPLLPGAGDPALVDVTELDNGTETRVVVSPLVEVRAKIVELAQYELFSVKVERGESDYWRLMSLDQFDGDLWRASSDFESAHGRVPSELDRSVLTNFVLQTITTTGVLENIYLPLAFELATVISSEGIELEYETESSALVVTREFEAAAAEGFTYVIESSVPVVDAPRIRSASTSSLDSDFLDRYTKLPRDFSESIKAEAERITEGAVSDYDRARLLQDYFQGDFTYDINVALEHDIDSTEAFLEIRKGYCEQFANAFAVMARSIGLPTRLAVGFTWGDWSASREEYIVRGEHAHAWPEVYFDGTGWIRFEPTPTRGGPNVSDLSVTGLRPAQTGTAPDIVVPTTSARPSDGVVPGPNEVPFGEDPFDTTVTPAEDGGRGGALPYTTILLVTSAMAVVLAIVPSLRLLQRRHRAARVAHDSKGRVELAWDDALEALELVEIRHRPQETPAEFAMRVDENRRDLGPVVALADSTTSARYSPDIDDSVVTDAEASAVEIRAVCHASASNGRRALALLDPRPLVKSR